MSTDISGQVGEQRASCQQATLLQGSRTLMSLVFFRRRKQVLQLYVSRFGHRQESGHGRIPFFLGLFRPLISQSNFPLGSRSREHFEAGLSYSLQQCSIPRSIERSLLGLGLRRKIQQTQ